MALKYYYDLLSQPSRALHIVLNMSKTVFKDCPVSLAKGEHMSSEFRDQVNRFQKVPCIVEEDTGFKLAESVAILRYLGAKNLIQPELYPKDTLKQCRVDEFLEWQHITIRAGCALYFWGVWLEPRMTGEQPSPKKIERLVDTMEKHLETMETVWLANDNQKFVCGDQLSAADIFGACEIEQTLMTPYNVRERYPKIAAWLNRVQATCNPHYDNAHKVVYKVVAKNKAEKSAKL